MEVVLVVSEVAVSIVKIICGVWFVFHKILCETRLPSKAWLCDFVLMTSLYFGRSSLATAYNLAMVMFSILHSDWWNPCREQLCLGTVIWPPNMSLFRLCLLLFYWTTDKCDKLKWLKVIEFYWRLEMCYWELCWISLLQVMIKLFSYKVERALFFQLLSKLKLIQH